MENSSSSALKHLPCMDRDQPQAFSAHVALGCWASFWWASIWFRNGKERGRKVHMLEKRCIWKGEWKGESADLCGFLANGDMVVFEHGLPPMAMSLSIASDCVMSVAPVTTINRKDRAAQNWPCPAVISEQRRTGPAPTNWSILEIRPCTSPGKQSRTDYNVEVGGVGLCVSQP